MDDSDSDRLLKSIKTAQWVQAVVIGLAALIVCGMLLVFSMRIESALEVHKTSMKPAEIVQALPNVTQTANPSITVNNGRAGWNLEAPHTVNDAATYLDRTPDTIRSYVPRWIESGIPIEKTEGGVWILPKNFEPYIPSD